MLVTLDIKQLPTIKRWLKTDYPNMQSAQRLQALARGLGYKSYEALLYSLETGSLPVSVNGAIFRRYVADLGISVSNRSLNRSLIRALIEPIIEAETFITIHGFGIPDSYGFSGDKYLDERTRSRNEFFNDWSCDQIELALIFLNAAQRRKTLNKKQSTYGLKHTAERLSRDHGYFKELGNYVANGAMIVAAYVEGYDVKRVSYDSLNGYINISARSVSELSDAQKLVSIFGDNPQLSS